MSSARIAPVPPYRSFFMPWTHSKTKETPSRLRVVLLTRRPRCSLTTTQRRPHHRRSTSTPSTRGATLSISTLIHAGAAAATGIIVEVPRRPACRPRPRTGPGARARLRVDTRGDGAAASWLSRYTKQSSRSGVDGVTVSTTRHLRAIDARRHDVAAARSREGGLGRRSKDGTSAAAPPRPSPPHPTSPP
jgi:hypothetical protein